MLCNACYLANLAIAINLDIAINLSISINLAISINLVDFTVGNVYRAIVLTKLDVVGIGSISIQ